MSTDISVIDFVSQQEPFFKNVNESQIVKWEKESQFAMQALQQNNYLAGVAQKNLASLQNSIVNVASVGISLNPANKHAYLVPRDGRVCLDISYMGLLHLAVQSGAIEWGQAKIVYENDYYENNGIDKAPTHKQKTFGDKGAIVGVYCTVKLPSGDYLTEEMDIDAINKTRQSSKAGKGPWQNWFEEMARKTVVKRAAKYWPTCSQISSAINVLNEHEGLGDPYEPSLVESGDADSFIDSEQKETIKTKIAETGADEALFLNFFKIAELQDLPKSKYSMAVSMLDKRAKK